MVPVRRVQQRRPVSNAPGPIAFFCSRCGEIRACSALFSRVFSCALYRVIFPAVGENFPAAPSLLENPALFGPWRVLKHPPEGGGVPPAQGPSRAHILALGGIFFNRVPAFSPCCS